MTPHRPTLPRPRGSARSLALRFALRLTLALWCLAAGAPPPAGATCNVIPGVTNAFASTLGTADRPFAGPGDIVKLSLDPTCDIASPGFAAAPAGQVVTVVFTPPAGGTTNAVVLTAAADCSGLAADLATCETALGGGTATCVAGAAARLDVVETAGVRRLSFRFPDTDAVFAPAGDDRTLTGPATIAVSPAGDPLPCGLATTPCAGTGGLIACIDAFLAEAGTGCGSRAHTTFPRFTALPPANDYQALCTDPPTICTGTQDELRLTVDGAGNLLVPMDWRGVLVSRDEVPAARLLRGSTVVEAFAGSMQPIVVPDTAFVGSYAPDGTKLLPLFDPQADPEAVDAITLFGTSDAPQGVIRIARRGAGALACIGGAADGQACAATTDCPGGSCGAATCAGGANATAACAGAADCPGGVCREGLFDFGTRLAGGVGPVLLAMNFDAAALDPVPLDGLVQTSAVNVFVLAEAIEDADLNGDGDATDDVLLLGDRRTGVGQPLGAPPVCALAGAPAGRAILRTRQPPFTFPAAAADDDVVAFLESEHGQGVCDQNGDLDAVDPILRVFRLAGSEVTAVVSPPRAVAVAPRVEGRSVAVSGGRVFFRSVEAAGAPSAFERVSVDSAGGEGTEASFGPTLSADGSIVAFASRADDLVPGDTNDACDLDGRGAGTRSCADVFVRDRATGTTTRVSVSSAGVEGDRASGDPADGSPSLAADGRLVAFASRAGTLVAGDGNDLCDPFGGPGTENCADVFVHDRQSATTERVSVASDGTEGNGRSFGSAMSADGRVVAFTSDASTLIPGDGNADADVFVRDRVAGTTERVSVASGGAEASAPTGMTFPPAISADGRFVAFASLAADLVPGDTNGVHDVFVRDRAAGTTERVSVSSRGIEGNAASGALLGAPALSADGRFVAFVSFASNLVAGDTNGTHDVFVRDRARGTTERVSVDSDGRQGPFESLQVALSADGRLVGFQTFISGFGPAALPGAHLHDRATGLTEFLGSNPSGFEAGIRPPTAPAFAADGRAVAFETTDRLAGDDTNDACLRRSDTFVFCLPGDPFPCDLIDDFDTCSGDLLGCFAGGGGCSCQNLAQNQNCADVYVRTPDPTVLTTDYFADGALDDTVLEMLDVASGTLTTLCPATEAAVAGGAAAFLRPEATSSSTGCRAGSLNADADTDDLVVHLVEAGRTQAQNLERAAEAVALSSSHVAALVSESADGALDLNGDGDALDTVAHVHPIGDGNWQSTGQAADTIDVLGAVAAFLTPEGAQGAGPLNGDGDTDDRVLQVYDATAATLVLSAGGVPTPPAGEDFVLGGTDGRALVAVRTREAAEGVDLNGDLDLADDVLQIYDVDTDRLLNTGQAVTPCRLEACDPRVPYRVGADTVTFLTLELDQGADLNGDGDTDDLVLQVFNPRLASELARRGALARASGRAAAAMTTAAPCQVLAAASAGVCTDTGRACATDADCPAGTCFVPPGGCTRTLAIACDPAQVPSVCEAECDPFGDEVCFCDPQALVCKRVEGTCAGDGDCDPGAVCEEGGQAFQRLVSPLAAPARGGTVLTSGGRCIEDVGTACVTDAECAPPAFCGAGGTCEREHGTCRTAADCPSGLACRQDLVVATANDADLDELPDFADNCPDAANVLQEDGDGDGVGDACDPETCGNGLLEGAEECDDGNVVAGDGCGTDCRLTCRPAPAAGCRAPAVAAQARLVLKDDARDARDRLTWLWRRGAATTAADFGDPTATDGYLLCVYDAAGLVLDATAPAAGVCRNDKPCWKPTRRGFRYRDRDRTPDGLDRLDLRDGDVGAATIVVKGRGPALALPDLAALTAPLTVQLVRRDGPCWNAVYSAFERQSGTVLRARAD